jgi:tetratricopeptide (TPR) repeat protein
VDWFSPGSMTMTLRVSVPFGQVWATDSWLRRPAWAQALLEANASDGPLEGRSLSLLAWLALTRGREEKKAEALARQALRRGGDTRFATAVLAEVLLRRGAYDQAVEVIQAARRRNPTVVWYDITLADALIEAGQVAAAEEVLEAAAGQPVLRRHALKRLSRLAMERGDRSRARRFLEGLVAIAPDYLVYASDYLLLGVLQLEAGDRDAARATWRRGARIYPRHAGLGCLLREQFGEQRLAVPPPIPPVDEAAVGARRIPVRTPLITVRTGMVEVIEQATVGLRQPGDLLAVSESAAAAGQGRMLPLELVRPGVLATRLSRFVGKTGPLSSPEGMQGAIMEAGRTRIALAAAAGAAGRLLGRHGWFYRVAGPATAMIDDVAACLPPHDHHIIFAPAQPDTLAEELAAVLGCGVAIVDANHRSGATVVGASAGVDRSWLVRVLADNPAGNEDEQTPVVIVRPFSR